MPSPGVWRPTDGTVLLTGESGTGKEMFVRAIHRLSRRKDCPLLACDCSALAPTLLESELFGHMKGSFSGAIATKQGLFEAAHQGTLFLDEVANLSMETQGKLLRVLETKRVKKVGDTAERDVDIRLISATNRELSEMVREGAFREDLYYRLNVVPIYLPPLRDRHGDIPRLAITFLERFCKKNQVDAKGFSSEAMTLMESYAWPGNVRELRNIVERLAILCDQDRIEPRHLPEEIRKAAAADDGYSASQQLGGVQAAQAAGPRRGRRAARTAVSVRGLGALRGQRQSCRRGDRHPADESARLDAQVRAEFGGVSWNAGRSPSYAPMRSGSRRRSSSFSPEGHPAWSARYCWMKKAAGEGMAHADFSAG